MAIGIPREQLTFPIWCDMMNEVLNFDRPALHESSIIQLNKSAHHKYGRCFFCKERAMQSWDVPVMDGLPSDCESAIKMHCLKQ